MTTAPNDPAPHPELRTYRTDDDLLLFDPRDARLFTLNSTAAYVWLSFAAGETRSSIATQLSLATEAPLEQVTRDVDRLFMDWEQAGLFATSERPARPAPPPAPPVGFRDARALSARNSIARSVLLMDRGVRIAADADLAAEIDAVFRSSSRGGASDAAWPSLTLFKHRGAWSLDLDGTTLGTCREREEIVPLLYGNSAKLIYESCDCFAAIHAAAVARGPRCVVMPAVSTSGKSTLTAALLAHGYDYCTDDLAILTAPPIHLRPVPMKIGLKSGSWAPLLRSWASIDSLPTYRRADGKYIKYLDPAEMGRARHPDERLEVVALVFPKFDSGASTHLRPMRRSDAFVALAQAGYDVTGTFTSQTVESMLEWFETLRCFELTFRNLDEAVDAFAAVLP